jgi:DNA-binding NarL/FixJ family response regulator
MRWRRYRTEDGQILTTYELPASVLRAVGMKNVLACLEAWHRGEVTRAAISARDVVVRQMLAEGIKPAAIAHEVGLSDSRVRQIREKQ